MKIIVESPDGTRAEVDAPTCSGDPREVLEDMLDAWRERDHRRDVEGITVTPPSTPAPAADDDYKFKVGQRVRVIGESNHHGKPIGHIGVIELRNPKGAHSADYLTYYLDNAATIFREYDLELAEEEH